jgi:lysyl-tRNA synthetase class 2
LLAARNAIARGVRRYFEEQDFAEVDAGAIQFSPGNETHIHAFKVRLHQPDGSSLSRYLHTSPEFAMKKLLAAGEKQIFSFGHVFRDREKGPLHASEFTLLEWYRVGDTYDQIIADCINLVRIAAEQTGTSILRYRERSADVSLALRRLSVADAFRELTGIDLLSSCREDGSTDREILAQGAVEAGISVRTEDGWSDIFSRVLVSLVEPQLAEKGLCLLEAYPRSEAALSAASNDDPRLADRFELYACGIELANGFRELTDPIEQRRRLETQMAAKHRIYGERYPIDEDLLDALALMPPASGVALGFDRLVMLATGAPNIHQVIWTPE